MPADITQRKGRTTPTVRRVRRTRYKKPIGPPAPGRKAPGPFPQSPSTSVPSPPGPATRRRAIRRHKRSKQYKRAIKAAKRSKKRAEAIRTTRTLVKRLQAVHEAQDNRRDAIGYDPGLTDLTPTKRVVPTTLRETPRTARTRDVLGGRDLSRFAQESKQAKQNVFKAAARLPDDPRAPRFPLKASYTPAERKLIQRRTEKFVRKVANPKKIKAKEPGKVAYRIAKRRTPEAAVEFAAYEAARSDPHDVANRLAGRRGKLLARQKDKSKSDVSVAGVDIDLSPTKALDLLLRPVYASAGAAEALRTGHPGDVPEKAVKGFTGKEKLTYSDVLKRGGAPPGVATVGGLVGDIFLTPDTYATLGLSVPAKVAARAARAATLAKYAKAGEAAERRVQREVAARVARKGAQGSARRSRAIEREVRARLENAPRKAKAERKAERPGEGVAERAGRRAYKADPAKNRGITVGFGKKTVKEPQGGRRKVRRASSGRATAAVGRTLHTSGAARTIRELPWYQAVGKAFHAGFRPVGTGEKAHAAIRQSRLETRHQLDSRLALADLRTREYEKALGSNEGTAKFVNDALEGYTSKRVARLYLARDKNGDALYDVPAPTRAKLERFVADDTRDYIRFRIKDLPDHADPAKSIRGAALNLVEDFKYLRRVRRESGAGGRGLVVEGKPVGARGRPQEARGYVPHVRRQDLDELEGTSRRMKVRRRQGAGTAREDIRQIREPLAAQREEIPHLFSERTPVLYAVQAQKSQKQAAVARHNRVVANTGRDLTVHVSPQGKAIRPDDLRIDTATEAYYHVGPRGKIRKLERDSKLDMDELNRALTTADQRIVYKNQAAQLRKQAEREHNPAQAQALREEADRLTDLAKPPPQGRYVIADRQAVDAAIEASISRPPEDLVGEWNKVMALWKKAVTLPMPSYHLRNLYGDAWNAHLESSMSELFRALGNTRGLLREYSQFKKSRVSLDRAARGGRLSPEVAFMVRAEELGVISAGFSRDIIEQLGKRTPGRLERASAWRENLMRLASYRAAVKRGVVDAEAARVVKRLHFDYGDLTDFERGVRALVPFYTFAAKNTALQARKIVSRPGKYANFEKVRVEGMKAAGMPADWQDRVPEYMKLQLGIPAFGVTSDGLPLLAMPGLPITDLNRLSPDLALGMVLQSLGPWRAAFETYLNTSVYFRDQIDRGRPVPAPDWVGALPETLRNMLDIERSKRPDAKTGEVGFWVWPAKTDFMVKQLPELNYLLQLTTSQKNRRGQGTLEKAVSLSGIRPQPYDELQNKLNKLFNDSEDLNKELDKLPSFDDIEALKGVGAAEKRRLTRRRSRLNEQASKIDERLYRASTKAGYVFPYGSKPTGHGGPLDRIDKALGGSSDNEALERIDKALGSTRGTDALERIDKALGR